MESMWRRGDRIRRGIVGESSFPVILEYEKNSFTHGFLLHLTRTSCGISDEYNEIQIKPQVEYTRERCCWLLGECAAN